MLDVLFMTSSNHSEYAQDVAGGSAGGGQPGTRSSLARCAVQVTRPFSKKRSEVRCSIYST